MICEQLRDQLVDTARGRDLSSDLRAGVFAHTAVCRECARLLENQTRLTVALSDLALETDSAPARLEQLLRRQLPVRKPERNFGWKLTAGIAAGLAALGLTGVLVLRPSAPPETATAKAAVPPAIASSVHLEARVLAPTPVLKGQKVRTSAAPATAETRESDNFIPLPFAPEISAEEPTNIVRVAFSRESLLAVGVPVSGNRFGEQVEADVLFGMDGTARAIRLTNE